VCRSFECLYFYKLNYSDRSEQLKLIEKLIHFYLEISSDLNVHVAAYLNRAMDLCIELQLYRKVKSFDRGVLKVVLVKFLVN
jgi:tRNA G37 N-methylase Trm5